MAKILLDIPEEGVTRTCQSYKITNKSSADANVTVFWENTEGASSTAITISPKGSTVVECAIAKIIVNENDENIILEENPRETWTPPAVAYQTLQNPTKCRRFRIENYGDSEAKIAYYVSSPPPDAEIDATGTQLTLQELHGRELKIAIDKPGKHEKIIPPGASETLWCFIWKIEVLSGELVNVQLPNVRPHHQIIPDTISSAADQLKQRLPQHYDGTQMLSSNYRANAIGVATIFTSYGFFLKQSSEQFRGTATLSSDPETGGVRFKAQLQQSTGDPLTLTARGVAGEKRLLLQVNNSSGLPFRQLKLIQASRTFRPVFIGHTSRITQIQKNQIAILLWGPNPEFVFEVVKVPQEDENGAVVTNVTGNTVYDCYFWRENQWWKIIDPNIKYPGSTDLIDLLDGTPNPNFEAAPDDINERLNKIFFPTDWDKYWEGFDEAAARQLQVLSTIVLQMEGVDTSLLDKIKADRAAGNSWEQVFDKNRDAILESLTWTIAGVAVAAVGAKLLGKLLKKMFGPLAKVWRKRTLEKLLKKGNSKFKNMTKKEAHELMEESIKATEMFDDEIINLQNEIKNFTAGEEIFELDKWKSDVVKKWTKEMMYLSEKADLYDEQIKLLKKFIELSE